MDTEILKKQIRDYNTAMQVKSFVIQARENRQQNAPSTFDGELVISGQPSAFLKAFEEVCNDPDMNSKIVKEVVKRVKERVESALVSYDVEIKTLQDDRNELSKTIG